jgi:hypothetical protein
MDLVHVILVKALPWQEQQKQQQHSLQHGNGTVEGHVLQRWVHFMSTMSF